MLGVSRRHKTSAKIDAFRDRHPDPCVIVDACERDARDSKLHTFGAIKCLTDLKTHHVAGRTRWTT
eukprot:scaffold3271_cov575-Pavlova_lutheri.AAC.1